MKTIIFLFLIGLIAVSSAGPSDPVPCGVEGEWCDPNWNERHASFIQNTANNPNIPIIFYGDSITDGWTWQQHWTQVFAPRGAVNYGIGGDQVQHVLYRILNGEVAGLNPKLIVLKIGTNNWSHTEQEIADGIRMIVTTLRRLLPNTKILLLSILPRTGENEYKKIASINIFISKIHDGVNVFYQNLFDHFGETWGTVSTALFSDGLHLTEAGYAHWYNIMYPWFFALCECTPP